MKIGDRVRIDHPGWYGHGQTGTVTDLGNTSGLAPALYVRLDDGSVFRHEVAFCTLVEAGPGRPAPAPKAPDLALGKKSRGRTRS